MRKWVLPEYIEDVLPAEAERTEGLRRVLLDHFRTRGYRLVQPPLVEHLESLLTGMGRDLELQTFKVVDPLSGRLLGLRADMIDLQRRVVDAEALREHGLEAPPGRVAVRVAVHADGGAERPASSPKTSAKIAPRSTAAPVDCETWPGGLPLRPLASSEGRAVEMRK